MPNDFINLSPLMALGILAAVVAFGAGGCAYMMWQDHKPELAHAINVALMICGGCGLVSVACIWLTRWRWMGRED